MELPCFSRNRYSRRTGHCFSCTCMAFLCLVMCTLLLEKWSCASCTMRIIRDVAIPNSFPESCMSPFSPLSCYVTRQLNTNLQVSVLTSALPKCCVKKINSSDTRKSKHQMFFMFTINTASHIPEDQRFWHPFLSFICARGKISQMLLLETKSQLKDLSCLLCVVVVCRRPPPPSFLFITTWNIGGAGSEVLSHHLNNIPISYLYK